MPLLPKRNSHNGAGARRCLRPLLPLSLVLGIVAVLLLACAVTRSVAFVPSNFQRSFCSRCDGIPTEVPTVLCASGDKNENTDLLEKARRLREEASLMEDDLRAGAAPSTSSVADIPVAIVNKILEESKWTLTYRFSSQPSPKDSDKNDDETPKKFYSGNVNLLLKKDGYSEQIIQKSDASKNEAEIEILKIWGWDRETSNEDNLDYLLFSMDIKFPASDPDLSNQKERYYFQARIEDEMDGSIALKEGTITVKKDVTEKTGGMWGFFNVAGILTEFRYTGDFVARASR